MDYKIITPIATEPLTLGEVKSHLRLTSNTLSGDMETNQSIAPDGHAVASAYSLVGSAVDVLGAPCVVNLNSGACGAGGGILAKVQESDDTLAWQDFALFAAVSEYNDNAVQTIEYTGGKKYVRVVATVSVATCSFGADIVTMSGFTTEDDFLTALITSAREYAENTTGRALATQTVEAYLSKFPCYDFFELPKPPLQSVTSLKYVSSDGTETTMAANTDYYVDLDSTIGRIILPYGKSWPSFTAYPYNAVKVRYVAGYTTTVPKSIKQAMLLLVAHWYQNREAVGQVGGQIEFAVNTLLRAYKVNWF